jgi:hypothetical protein
MPWRDWQFWLVSLAAVGAVALFLRAVLPRKKKRRVRTQLTISAGAKDRGPDRP